MTPLIRPAWIVAAALWLVALNSSAGAGEDHGRTQPAAGWRLLFNGKDLSGWRVTLQEGNNGGAWRDRIVSIDEGAIHLYKDAPDGIRVPMGYIATEKEYGDYHLRVEYKWGKKKFEPRSAIPRDAGVYYHIFGPDEVWPKSVQCQIQEGDVGDLITLHGAQCDTWIKPGPKTGSTAEEMNEFLDPIDGGEPTTLGGSGLAYQGAHGMVELEGWNTLEIIARGDTAMHILNGKLVNRCERLRVVEAQGSEGAAKSRPLTRGRIALEIEAAEILYRNVEIRSLEEESAPAELTPSGAEPGLRVGAAAVVIPADNDMVIAGGIGPWKPSGPEGDLRATAIVMEKAPDPPCAIVGLDVLFVTREQADAAKARIREATGIAPENVMISATHTHGAPSTVRVHGYGPEPKFITAMVDAIVKSVVDARKSIRGDCRFEFAEGAEYGVGENSRILLSDGEIFWGGPREDALRPTAPFDPQLPVLAFRERGGDLLAAIFNHSTHTIGTPGGMLRSPAFYGLAAQDLEREKGGVFCFLQGASGSTHNLTLLPQQAKNRIQAAVTRVMGEAKPRSAGRVRSITRPFKYRVRTFDEATEQAKVERYCRSRMPQGADPTIEIFRTMRRELAPHQGEERETWLQVIAIGDVAIAAAPAEYFTVFGVDIKRRSPFARTYVNELANDWIGYLPDRRGHELGGYQTWMGLHSYCAEGTGEAVADALVAMLEELKRE